MKRSSSYLCTVPVVDGSPLFPRETANAVLRDTNFRLRFCGRNRNRKQFYPQFPERARTEYHMKNGLVDYTNRVQTQRGGLQQDFPVRLSTHCDVYISRRRWSSDDGVIAVNHLKDVVRRTCKLFLVCKQA